MWKVLAPLIVLVIVLLIQLQVSESFVTESTITMTTKDASGNTLDSSGNIITSTTTPATSTISLTLADLLALFKAATPPPPPPPPQAPAPPSSKDLYNEIQPKLMSDIQGVMSTYLSGSPYTPAAPLPSAAPCSDSAAQGMEYQNALNDYIKKDEIPCYGCTL